MQRGERSPAEPRGEGSGQRVETAAAAAAIIAKPSLSLGGRQRERGEEKWRGRRGQFRARGLGIGRSGAVSHDVSTLRAGSGTSWHRHVKGLVQKGCAHPSVHISLCLGMRWCVLGCLCVCVCVCADEAVGPRVRAKGEGCSPRLVPSCQPRAALPHPSAKAPGEGGRQTRKAGKSRAFPSAWGRLQEPPTSCLHLPGWLAPAVPWLLAGWVRAAPCPGARRELLGTAHLLQRSPVPPACTVPDGSHRLTAVHGAARCSHNLSHISLSLPDFSPIFSAPLNLPVKGCCEA